MAAEETQAIVKAPRIVSPERLLTERESVALNVVREARIPVPPLSPTLEARLFALFLQGIDCVEITRLNPGLVLGQIVRARIESGWDQKRLDHVEVLLTETAKKYQQTIAESTEFVGLQLAAANRIYGDKVKKFLQTGDEADLGSFAIVGWDSYRKAVELMKSLTGQDGTGKKAPPEPLPPQVHQHLHVNAAGNPVVPAVNRAMTTDEAASVIEAELVRRKG